MRFNRTLAIGILTCLVFGVLIGASQATIEGTVDDSPMTIPTSRIGDRVTYVDFERPNDLPEMENSDSGSVSVSSGGLLDAFLLDGQVAGATAGGGSANTEEWTRVSTVQLLRLDAALDETGERRDVVVLSENGQWNGEEAGSTQEDRTQLQFVDLQTRLAIQNEMKMRLGAPFDWDLAYRWFSIDEAYVPGLEHQGATLRLGDDLTAAWVERNELLSFGDDLEAPQDGPLIEETKRRWVADRALIDGRDAYAVRTEHRVVALLNESDRAQIQEFFRIRPGNTVTGTYHGTVWVSADSAYPLLTEAIFQLRTGDNDLTLMDSYSVLQENRAGTGAPVPWGPDPPTHRFRAFNPSLERTPAGILHPGDGVGSKLTYPLSAAINDVRSDVRLVQFQAWRQQNPVHYLVAADLGPGERNSDASATAMWRLVFATPFGNGFEVTTERVNPSLPPITESRGAKTTKAFTLADLPVGSVTIAAAERYWLELAGDRYQGKAPNYVHWGFLLPTQSGTACLSRSWSSTQTNAPQLSRLVVGYSNEGPCIARSDAHDESTLTLSTESGNLSHLHEWFIDYDRQPLGSFDTQTKSIAIRTKSVPFTPRAPDVEKAAVASTSLLAAFLLMYFLPALKFVGAKGLLLLPGYAKLRKEELLDNKIRDQILQVVRNDPGITTTDLAKRVDAGWGTTVYHLGVLEKNQMVSSLVDGRYHRFFPVGVMDFSARGQIAVLKNQRTRSIYELIAQDPGIVQENLASRVGISAPAAIFHLKRLEEIGMVGRVKRGRKVHYYANETPRAAAPEPSSGMEIQ